METEGWLKWWDYENPPHFFQFSMNTLTILLCNTHSCKVCNEDQEKIPMEVLTGELQGLHQPCACLIAQSCSSFQVERGAQL